MSGKEVAAQLESMGYFKYALPAEVEPLKNEISNAYDEYGMLSSIYLFKSGKHYPKDFRLYSLDNEVLFQQNGYSKFLTELQPTFKKLKIPVTVDDEKESFSESKGYTHTITINGIKYPILKNFRDYSRGSVVPIKKFIETVNQVLKLPNSEERVYPISKGSDGQLVFLTQKQFRYISAVYPNNENRPLKVKEWARRYDAKKADQ